jgi:hypothetical protein
LWSATRAEAVPSSARWRRFVEEVLMVRGGLAGRTQGLEEGSSVLQQVGVTSCQGGLLTRPGVVEIVVIN